MFGILLKSSAKLYPTGTFNHLYFLMLISSWERSQLHFLIGVVTEFILSLRLAVRRASNHSKTPRIILIYLAQLSILYSVTYSDAQLVYHAPFLLIRVSQHWPGIRDLHLARSWQTVVGEPIHNGFILKWKFIWHNMHIFQKPQAGADLKGNVDVLRERVERVEQEQDLTQIIEQRNAVHSAYCLNLTGLFNT